MSAHSAGSCGGNLIKSRLISLFHRTRCRRDILVPMLDKLEDRELESLLRFVREVEEEGERSGQRKAARQPWRIR